MEVEDRLGRDQFVKFVENLIFDSNQYKRANDCSSYVMAIDSPWGTGKSFFIELLIKHMEENDKINVVKYNAWENDYCDNAFNPLIYDILNSDCLKFSTENDADLKNAKNILKSISKVGLVYGKEIVNEIAKSKLGIDMEKIIETGLESVENFKNFAFKNIPHLKKLNEYRESFKEFKEYLSNATGHLGEKNGKLVVIIDELDRCKPTFAIETLEIVKHLFDIDNIVFIFAIDIQQLGYSISSVYGQGFDAVGYLCRFFDYIAKMPSPDVRPYVNYAIELIPNIPQIEVPKLDDKFDMCYFNEIIINFIIDLYKGFDFSLRDLDTVIQTYKIMVNNFLYEYEMVGAHIIYLFYVALKYKKPDIFYKVFIDATLYHEKYVVGDFANYVNSVISNNCWIDSSIRFISKAKTMEDCAFRIWCDGNGKNSYAPKYRINSVKGDNIIIYPDSSNSLNFGNTEKINPMLSVDNVLFAPDLYKWNEIKKTTYRNYIHKQLEMYNFIIRDESESID